VYYVKSVRTTFQAGKLTQTFIAERNSFGLSGSESYGQTEPVKDPSD
jgi:hypothetical protein